MKVIDICEDYGGLGCLKKYYVDLGIKDYNIYAMGLNLAIGDLKHNRDAFLKELYEDPEWQYHNYLEDVANGLNDDTILRVWSSKKNDNDYLLLLYVCNYFKGKINNLHIVFCDDYNENICSIAATDAKEIKGMLEYEQELTKEEIQEYARLWNGLLEANSELRVLEEGKVKNKKYADYYTDILDILREEKEITIANLIAKCMVNKVINDAGSIIYSYLIDKLISMGKIKVIEKKERHFVDVIELGGK